MERTNEWVTSGAVLEERLASVGSGPLAVDTEGDSFHHYPEKVCLIQLSFGSSDLLVDPLAQFDPEPLRRRLADAGLTKILHGADYDLRVLDRDFGIVIRGLFDTMIASRLSGEKAFGLASLLERHLGVRVDKKYQRADWSLRPLTPGMKEYAVSDTRHLEELAAILENRLEALGRRAWAEEEFRRLESVRWSVSADDPEAYLKVKRANMLAPRELAVVRELHELRERAARKRDRPPFRIFPDESIVALARDRPTRPEQLREIPRLSHHYNGGRGGRELLDAVARACALPDDQLPRPKRGTRKRLSSDFEARVKRLARRRDRVADSVDLDPSLIAPKSLLIEIQRRLDEGLDPGETPDLRRWQAGLLLPALTESGD